MTFFSSCGQIESVKVIYDPITGNSKGFGFITFVDAAVATALRAQGKVDMYGKQVCEMDVLAGFKTSFLTADMYIHERVF